AGRPLADMRWARETEGHSFDTPERRAALEARVNELMAQIGGEAVRKYYRQDFAQHLADFLAPPPRESRGRNEWREPRSRGGNWRERRNNGDWQPQGATQR